MRSYDRGYLFWTAVKFDIKCRNIGNGIIIDPFNKPVDASANIEFSGNKVQFMCGYVTLRRVMACTLTGGPYTGSRISKKSIGT